MSEGEKLENNQGKSTDDPKTKMLAALAKKQKGNNSGKFEGRTIGSKIGAGQTAGSAPKMHRRKSGPA
jgi:hypothetical protein